MSIAIFRRDMIHLPKEISKAMGIEDGQEMEIKIINATTIQIRILQEKREESLEEVIKRIRDRRKRLVFARDSVEIIREWRDSGWEDPQSGMS